MPEELEQSTAPIESAQTDAAPITNSEVTDTTAAPSTQTTITDLDKLDRVRFGGKEYGIKELRAAFMRQQDYSKKTKELAETRKYSDNFAADFVRVARDPRLIDEFKKVYPAQYHALLEDHLRQMQSGQAVQSGEVSQSENLPPEVQKIIESKLKPFEERIGKIDAWEASVKEQETRAVGEQIETLHDRLGKKYEFADPDLVDHRVLAAKEQGVEITRENIGKVYETIYKDMHEKTKARLDKQYSTKVTEQVKAGRSGKDVVGGGGVPAAPAKKFTSSKELFSDMNKTLLSR